MNRIATTFASLKAQNKKALIPFITAGDSDPLMTVPLMHELVHAGRRTDYSTIFRACIKTSCGFKGRDGDGIRIQKDK